MRRISFATASIATAALGLALSVAAPAPASATTLTFTWDPSATGDSTVGPFMADHFSLSDFATIRVPANPTGTGSVNETGFLFPTTFFLGGDTTANANVKGTWGIYETFTATSHLDPCTTGLCGAFDSITANVYVYSTDKGVASVSFPGSVPTLHLPVHANPVLIASLSGPTTPSPNFANIVTTTSGSVPTANVDTLFTPNPAEAGFFVNPPVGVLLDLEQAFTNTAGVITSVPSTCKRTGALPCTFEIRSGGGNGDFLFVPEPASIAIFGLGLTVLGFVRRRRA